MNFNNIVGDKIKNIYLLVDSESTNFTCIEQILIETFNSKLLISVDKDYDEIILKIDNSLYLDLPESDQAIIKVTNDSNSELNNLLSKKVIWTWTLNNNQGYEDGFQIQVQGDDIETIYQFLVIGSAIKIYRLEIN